MRVFVTGATGFIGSAIVRELLGAGHQVLGLARSESSATALKAAGADVHRGDLDDLESLRRGTEVTDGVIHAGYNHDWIFDTSGRDIRPLYLAAAETDRRAIEAMGNILAGSDRPLVVTSGTAVMPAGRLATENDRPDSASAGGARVASEDAALSMAAHGVRVSVVRLPPSVHGDGDHGFVPALIGIAREKGVSGYVGDGTNRWPTVHRLDAASLFRLALEHAPAGSKLHSVAEEGVPMHAIAAAIGRNLNLATVSVPSEKAGEHFARMALFVAIDNPTSSSLTRQLLGWTPTQANLIQDLDQGTYFAHVAV